ncbi:MAG: glycosyl hydrolase 53 family protein [Balneolaceae bacterium]
MKWTSKYIKTFVTLLLFTPLVLETLSARQAADTLSSVQLNYAIGADLSFLKMAEEQGMEFKVNGEVKPGLEIFREHGYNWIRLRLFHSPDRLPNNLEYTIELAKEAKARGFKFLLNYHYADSWADPGQQPIPAAWEGLDIHTLADSVFEYTRDTITAFREAGVMPDMVQPGNEIRNGMLWPIGRLPENWDNFAALIKAGIDGVDAGRGTAPRPLMMVHYDQGADAAGSKVYYDTFHSYGIAYDVIGLSYYPWWHGSLLELRENLLSLVRNYDQDIIVVEAAYNWRPGEYEDPSTAPFPESPEGQREYLESVNDILLSIGSEQIKGIFWWEPAVSGGLGRRSFFDADGNALPVINVFNKYSRGSVD